MFVDQRHKAEDEHILVFEICIENKPTSYKLKKVSIHDKKIGL